MHLYIEQKQSKENHDSNGQSVPKNKTELEMPTFVLETNGFIELQNVSKIEEQLKISIFKQRFKPIGFE